MTQLVSPQLIRALNTRYLSNIISGDLSTDEELAEIQAAMNLGGTFVWDRSMFCLNRNIGTATGIFNIGALERFIGEPDLCFDMSLMPKTGSPRYAFVTSNGDQTPTALTVSGTVGDLFVTIGGTAVTSLGLEVGHHVSITADKVFIAGGTAGAEDQGERARIVKIDGGDVYLSRPLQDTYLTSDGATLRRVLMYEKMEIEGVSVLGCGQFDADTIGDRGFHLIHLNDMVMRNCSAKFCDNGNYIYSSSGIIEAFKFQFDLQPAVPRASNQYGLAYVNACQDMIITKTEGIAGKHGVVQTESDFVNGVSRRVLVENSTLTLTWNYAIATHTNAQFLYFENNKLDGCNGGIELGCRDLFSKNNQIYNTPDTINQGIGFNVSDIADNINSTGDKVYGCRFGFRLNESIPLFSGSQGPRNINVMDFYCTDAANAAISIKSTHTGTKDNIHIIRPTTRRTGNRSDGVITAALSVDIDGDFEKVSVRGGDLQAVPGNSTACLRTVGVQDAHVTDNTYSEHGAPIVGGAVGANLVTRNNVTYS